MGQLTVLAFIGLRQMHVQFEATYLLRRNISYGFIRPTVSSPTLMYGEVDLHI